MILINGQELPKNADKTHPLYSYAREYKNDLASLKSRFPKGIIRLSRMGWPKFNATGLLEPVPMITIPMTCTADSEAGEAQWAYCDGRSTILPNGLRELPTNKRMMKVGESLAIDLNKQPDLAVFIFKTKFVGLELRIDDPETEAINKALARQGEIELGGVIWNGIANEEKLRMIASAWGVTGAAKTDIRILKAELEKRVLFLENHKQQNAADLSRKGVKEFLDEVKGDKDMMLRSLIQNSIDEKAMQWSMTSGHYLLKNRKFLFVPSDYEGRHVDYIASYLSSPSNEEQLTIFLTEVLTAELIDGIDKIGLAWLCSLYNVDTKGKAPVEQKEALKGVVCA